MKKVIFALLILALIFSTIPMSVSADSSDTELNDTRNLKFIENSSDRVVYTHEEDGESFKTVENIVENESGKEIFSTIYKKDKNGEYKEETSIITVLNEENDILNVERTEKDGKKTYETINLKESEVAESPSFITPFSCNEICLEHPGGGSYDWQYVGTYYYSDAIRGLTVTGISAAIGATLGGWGGAAIGAVAAQAYNEKYPTLYYKVTEYGYYIDGTIIPGGKAEYAYIYTDKYRTTLVPGESYPITNIVHYDY